MLHVELLLGCIHWNQHQFFLLQIFYFVEESVKIALQNMHTFFPTSTCTPTPNYEFSENFPIPKYSHPSIIQYSRVHICSNP